MTAPPSIARTYFMASCGNSSLSANQFPSPHPTEKGHRKATFNDPPNVPFLWADAARQKLAESCHNKGVPVTQFRVLVMWTEHGRKRRLNRLSGQFSSVTRYWAGTRAVVSLNQRAIGSSP